MARKLAIMLNQESIAVFIPSKKSVVGDTILKLKSRAYTVNEAIKIIHEKLPAEYSQAFSFHLNNICSTFDNVTVKEIEWLGSKISAEEIIKIFPYEDIFYHDGKAYLIYKNGRKEKL